MLKLDTGGRLDMGRGSRPPEEVRSAKDSALEGDGFEPSVPRDATRVSRPAHVASAWFPANGKVGAKENRQHQDVGRFPAKPMVRIPFPSPKSQTNSAKHQVTVPIVKNIGWLELGLFTFSDNPGAQ